MKRILAVVVMLLMGLGAYAQISNVKTSNAITTIAKFRSGLCSLKCHGDTYYLTINSTNRFDDPVIIFLGDGKESATRTLLDLQDLHRSMDVGGFAEFTIEADGMYYKYKVSKFNNYNFSFHDMGTAGSVYFATTEMKTLIKKLAAKNER